MSSVTPCRWGRDAPVERVLAAPWRRAPRDALSCRTWNADLHHGVVIRKKNGVQSSSCGRVVRGGNTRADRSGFGMLHPCCSARAHGLVVAERNGALPRGGEALCLGDLGAPSRQRAPLVAAECRRGKQSTRDGRHLIGRMWQRQQVVDSIACLQMQRSAFSSSVIVRRTTQLVLRIGSVVAAMQHPFAVRGGWMMISRQTEWQGILLSIVRSDRVLRGFLISNITAYPFRQYPYSISSQGFCCRTVIQFLVVVAVVF